MFTSSIISYRILKTPLLCEVIMSKTVVPILTITKADKYEFDYHSQQQNIHSYCHGVDIHPRVLSQLPTLALPYISGTLTH